MFRAAGSCILNSAEQNVPAPCSLIPEQRAKQNCGRVDASENVKIQLRPKSCEISSVRRWPLPPTFWSKLPSLLFLLARRRTCLSGDRSCFELARNVSENNHACLLEPAASQFQYRYLEKALTRYLQKLRSVAVNFPSRNPPVSFFLSSAPLRRFGAFCRISLNEGWKEMVITSLRSRS